MKRLFISCVVLLGSIVGEMTYASNQLIVVNKSTNNYYAWPMLVRRATILKTPSDLVTYSNVAVNTPLKVVNFGEPLPEVTNEAKDAKKARERQRRSMKRYAAQKVMCTGDSLLRTFYWEGKAEKYVLTIFNAEATNKYIVSDEQAKNGVAFTLSPGKYTWQVAPLKEDGIETEEAIISDSIYVENPFYIDNITSQVTDETENKVTCSWKGNNDYYVVFIYEEPTKKILASIATKSTSVDAILPTEGTYSFALMGVNPYGYKNVVCSALLGKNDNIEDPSGEDIREDVVAGENEIIYDANDPNAGFDKDKPFYDILGRPVNIYYRGVVVQEGRRFLLWY